MTELDRYVVDWLAVVQPGAIIRSAQGLRAGGSPWLVELVDAHGATTHGVVRVGGPDDLASMSTEVAALDLLAAAHAPLPVPRVLATNLADEPAPATPLVMVERLPGTSHVSGPPALDRFRVLGAATAELHRVTLPADVALPRRDRPISTVDFAALRATTPSALLDEAARVVEERPDAAQPDVFVHGDLWQGNTMWDGERLCGLVDWDCAGVGHPGVDIGSLRCDAAVAVGPEAADEVLAGYRAAGCDLTDVARWDLVGGLSTPPTMDWFSAAMVDQGRTDLARHVLVARRDAFVRAALGRLA